MNKLIPLAWPSAILLCIRNPIEHHALLEPYQSYKVGYPNIFGPPRNKRCNDCGAAMYTAGARIVA